VETSFQAGHANVHLHGACFLHRRARPMPCGVPAGFPSNSKTSIFARRLSAGVVKQKVRVHTCSMDSEVLFAQL